MDICPHLKVLGSNMRYLQLVITFKTGDKVLHFGVIEKQLEAEQTSTSPAAEIKCFFLVLPVYSPVPGGRCSRSTLGSAAWGSGPGCTERLFWSCWSLRTGSAERTNSYSSEPKTGTTTWRNRSARRGLCSVIPCPVYSCSETTRFS